LKLNLAKMLEDPKVADKLAQAGYPGPKPLNTFYFFRFAIAVHLLRGRRLLPVRLQRFRPAPDGAGDG
jgi:hypothetical protein